MEASPSPHGVRATCERAIAALSQRGVQLFARIDHAGAARAAGLELADEEVLIFGDPRVGTQLMASDPRIGYELPLRLLVWDAGGQTMIGFQPPPRLADAYDVAGHAGVLEAMHKLLRALVAASVAED